jgi:hypothetical protein
LRMSFSREIVWSVASASGAWASGDYGLERFAPCHPRETT